MTRPPLPTSSAALLAAATLLGGLAAAADDPAWPVIGRQGLIRVVIVPLDQAADAAAYARQVPLLCGAMPTCFINFYTNSRNVSPAVPLPDEIMSEATAILRRSDKQQTEGFRWSCRLGRPDPDCF